jgi:predicted esterase
MVRRSRWPVSPTRCFVFPEAPHRFYLTEGSPPRAHQDLPVGASWMTRDLREHDIEDNLRYLDAVVDRVGDLAPQADVRVLGFSQGGATAVRWAAARAASGRTVARLVVWGSLLPPDVTLSGAAPLAQAPLDLVMGTRDRWVSEERFAAEVERVVQAGAPVLVHRFEGGHRFDDTTLAAVVADASS